MPTFDAASFAKGLLEPVREAVKPFLTIAGDDAKDILRDYDALEKATTSTLDAVAATPDQATQKLLQDDIAKFLPARRAALLARTANKLSSDAQGALEAALTVVEKAAIIAAKSFI